MTLRQQFAAINRSACANDIAWSFILGFSLVSAEYLLGEKFDIVTLLAHLANRVWLLGYLQAAFNASVAAALPVARNELLPQIFKWRDADCASTPTTTLTSIPLAKP